MNFKYRSDVFYAFDESGKSYIVLDKLGQTRINSTIIFYTNITNFKWWKRVKDKYTLQLYRQKPNVVYRYKHNKYIEVKMLLQFCKSSHHIFAITH